MAPRWTYSEANATRWRHLFDDLLAGTQSVELTLEGNGKSHCSLHIRISDVLKWLANQFRAGDADMEPYTRLKRQLRTVQPCASTANGYTPTTPSRTLTQRFESDYNRHCNAPT